MKLKLFLLLLIIMPAISEAQQVDPYKPDFTAPRPIAGMQLTWSDEFNTNGKPDPKNWSYENGFVRNQELQWYKPDNVNCVNGVLLIEARKENYPNPNYKNGSGDWRSNRRSVDYTSASIRTKDLRQWTFGRFEIRARIDTSTGSWPAIWTLGANGRWPLGGEIDIMEFYRPKGVPTILANIAWGRNDNGGPVWNTKMIALAEFTKSDPAWVKKFHTWRMDWTKDSIKLYLDDQLLNTNAVRETLNPDSSNPFLQPHYLLLNLAIGANGGNPSNTVFPIKYEVDYVRHYRGL
jgi:beta-glucanase (GH16 family)